MLLAFGLFGGPLACRLEIVVVRLSARSYRSLIDGLMLCSGISLPWAAVR